MQQVLAVLILVFYPVFFVKHVNSTDSESVTIVSELTTYKYPTATWKANNSNRTEETSTQKLYLFKPSPFLKPPFIDGNFGVSITRIDDGQGLNVTGKRRGKIKYKQYIRKARPTEAATETVDENEDGNNVNAVDKFLEQSLKKYLFSSHFRDIIGDITVQEFAEVLRNITAKENKRQPPPYDENKNHYMKFREESLSPKRNKIEETTVNYILTRQLKRRLEKHMETLPFITTTPSVASIDNEILNTGENNLGLLTVTVTPDSYQKTEFNTSVNNESTNSTSTTFPPTTETTHITSTFAIFTTSEKNVIHPTKKYKSRGRVRWTTTTTTSHPKNKELSVAESAYYTIKPYVEQSLSTIEEPNINSIPGEPGIDYPMYSSPPLTGFKCPTFRGDGPHMLADRKTRCQVFYVCTGDGPAPPTLCPNGTMFNEQVLVCDWWYNVDC